MELRIETERLIIRTNRESDLESLQKFAGDAETTKFMVWGPNNIEDSREFLRKTIDEAKKEEPDFYECAVTLKNGGTHIGGCGLYMDRKNQEAELGYCFNKEYWGNGYAAEAAKAMIRFGFAELKLHRIYATCDDMNTASYKVMEKAGMTREGRLREHKMIKGRRRSSYIYGILKNEIEQDN